MNAAMLPGYIPIAMQQAVQQPAYATPQPQQPGPYGYNTPVPGPPLMPPGFDMPFSPPPALAPALIPSPMQPQMVAMMEKIKNLSPSEVNAYTTTLERVGLKAWLDNFVYLMENKSAKLRQLLQLSVGHAQQALAVDPGLQEADGYLARQIDCVLDPKSNNVKAFKAKLAHNRQVARSGVLKLAHIRRMCSLMNGAEVRIAEQEFEARRFFKAHMTKSEATAQIYELANEFELLARCTGEVSTMFEILKKMPAHLADKADNLYDELSAGQVVGRMPYSFEHFVDIVAIHLSRKSLQSGPARSRDKVANQAEYERADGAKEVTCLACGQAGHTVKECPKSCPKCHLKPCPGTYGQSCVVHTNRDVPKEVKNAVGSVLPAYLHKVLATKNAQFREGNAPAAQRRKESGANGRKAYVAEAEKEQGPEVNSCCHEVVDEHMSSDEEDVFPARRVCAMADMSAVVGGGGKNIMISETRSSSTQTDTECGEDVSGAGPSCDRLNCAQTTVMPEDDRQACATGAGPSCDRVLGGLMPKVHPTPTHNEFMTHDYGDVTKCEDQCGNATRGDVIASACARGFAACRTVLMLTIACVLAGVAATGGVNSLHLSRSTSCLREAHAIEAKVDQDHNKPSSSKKMRFMIDGGSNTNILKINRSQAEAFGLSEADDDGVISGFAVGSAMSMLGTVCATLRFTPGACIDLIDACYVPKARHSILSESYLVDRGVTIVKSCKRQSMIFPDQSEVELERVNGLYFCEASLECLDPTRTAAMTQLKADDNALLWAARLSVGPKDLIKISKAVRGIDVDRIPEKTAEAIDRDRFRRLQCSKKRPVNDTPVRDLAEMPGEVFICDGFGKHSAASPIDGAVYQLHAIDEKTDFGYVKSVTSHTVEDWMGFLREVALDARAHGHTPKVFRFDQAPELRSKSLEDRINRELGMQVELTPRSHHEGVGRVEINNDILTRRAEANLQRAQKGTAFLLPAREYAQKILNLKPSGASSESRFQRYYGKIPSIDRDRPPYLFGTHVMFHEEKEARGPKGSLEKPRASQGTIVGLRGRHGSSGDIAYLVMRKGGGIVTPRHVDPIDELQLLRRGIPTGAATAEASTQTPSLGTPLTQPLAQRKEPAKKPVIDLPIGSRIGVMWLPKKGAEMREYIGTVVDELVRAGCSKLYKVKYDDTDEPLLHDLSHTKRTWRVVSRPSDAPSTSEPIPRTTRARTRAAQNPAGSSREANKATQNIIDVVTDLGNAQFKVPANKREVKESPQSEEWLAADQKALDAILKAGNVLVPVSKPESLGVPIARTVTARRIKIDPATGRLAENNPFKSRHNVDGGYLKVQQEQQRQDTAERSDDEQVPTTSTVVDDLTLKMFLAYAAEQDLELVKGDVGNAYAKGKSTRRVGYMHLPSTLPLLDEDDTPLCIELHTPMWGEREAGYEWQRTLTETILKLGWVKCEGVPAMYSFHEAGKTIPATMITIVDDFLIAGMDTSIALATCRALKDKFQELSMAVEPDSFAGYKVARDRKARTLTLSMPQKIIEAAREHLPQMFEGGEKANVLKGGKLMNVADGLKLASVGSRHKWLNADQKATQSIIGSLKFIERVMPEITLPLHRLSCVMSAPPPEALEVAKGVLHYAYVNKDNGITYGGASDDGDEHVGIEGRAPSALSASADATWGDGRNLYGLMLTYNHGTVVHMTKKIRSVVESSHHSEAIATSKAAEQVVYAREVLRALGMPSQLSTKIATDNRANLLVAHDATSAKRARHFLRQYHTLQQRIQAGDITIVKMPTAVMPADFLTKWITGQKLKKSVRYATNTIKYVAA